MVALRGQKSGEAVVYFLPLNEEETTESIAAKTQRVLAMAKFGDLIPNDRLVAIKQHFGEKGNDGYIKPEVTKVYVDLVKAKGGCPLLVETNTLYRGERSNSYRHLMLAYEHGFSIEALGAPVVILDGVAGQNQHSVPINGKHFSSVNVVSDIPFFDAMFVLSHIKGHMMTGMGGAIKNLGMGLSSRAGKLAQHSEFRPEIDYQKCICCEQCSDYCLQNALEVREGRMCVDQARCVGCGECYVACPQNAISFQWGAADSRMQERLAEHALGAVVNHRGRVGYVNYFNHVCRHCDCWGGENPVLERDLGIFASLDPVAVDRACYDVAKESYGRDIFKEFWPELDSTRQFAHAEEIGLGSQRYGLVTIEP